LTLALADFHEQEARLLTVFRRGKTPLQAFETEMDAIERERTLVQAELTRVQQAHKRQSERMLYLSRSVTLMARWRAELDDIEASNDRQAMQTLIADFVASITVQPDGAHIVYRFDETTDSVVEESNAPNSAVRQY
jgi:hypothetical protein